MKRKAMKKKATKKTMKKAEPTVPVRSYKPTGGAMPDPREAEAAEAAAMMNSGSQTPAFSTGFPPTASFGAKPSSEFVGASSAPFGSPMSNPGFGGGGRGGFGGNRGGAQFDFVTILFLGKEGKSYSTVMKNDERGKNMYSTLMTLRPGDAIGVSKTKTDGQLSLWIRRGKGGNQGGGVPF